MKRLQILAAVLGAVLLTDAPSPAYVLGTQSWKGKLRHPGWRAATFPLPFVLSDQPLQLLPNLARDSALPTAIEAAMSAWHLGPVELTLDGTVAVPEVNWDGVNLITFASTPKNRDVVANFVAVTIPQVLLYDDGHVRLTDADIIFNPKVPFATDGSANFTDIQGVLTHELGHALGLDHSPIPSATMWPYVNSGDTFDRSLHPDDLAGVRALYNLDPDPTWGTISGQVLTSAGAPVFGAHVSATDGDGSTRVGALTDWDGNFTLTSLPAGSYTVWAQPLTGGFSIENLGGTLHGDSQHVVLHDFQMMFAGGNQSPTSVAVAAGQTTAVDPIRVVSQPPSVSPQHWTWRWDYATDWSAGAGPIQIPAGRRIVLGIKGAGMSLVSAYDVSFSGSDVRIEANAAYTDTSNNSEWLVFPLSVGWGARPGSRSLYLTRGQEREGIAGVLEILAP